MPQASAFTNTVRAYAEGRNNKTQLPGNILNIDTLAALSCSRVSWIPLVYNQVCRNCKIRPIDIIPTLTGTLTNSVYTLTLAWTDTIHELLNFEFFLVGDPQPIFIGNGSGKTGSITSPEMILDGTYYVKITSSSQTINSNNLTVTPPLPLPPAGPRAVLGFYNNFTQLKVTWYNIPSTPVKIDFFDDMDTEIYGITESTTDGTIVTPPPSDRDGVKLSGSFWYVRLNPSNDDPIFSNTLNAN